MRLKSELYSKEQDGIIDKIINILNLDKENSITLYELDNDIDKQNKILNLTPDIRKYYNFSKIPGVYYSQDRISRPWLSIIRQITKKKFNMYSTDYRFPINNTKVRTTKYVFIKK
jgi:hypothetical protein